MRESSSTSALLDVKGKDASLFCSALSSLPQRGTSLVSKRGHIKELRCTSLATVAIECCTTSGYSTASSSQNEHSAISPFKAGPRSDGKLILAQPLRYRQHLTQSGCSMRSISHPQGLAAKRNSEPIFGGKRSQHLRRERSRNERGWLRM